MNIKQIRELAQIVSANGLTELQIDEGDTHIRMARAASAPPIHAEYVPVSMEQPVPPMEQHHEPGVDFNRSVSVKSNLIGVFYAAPSPDAAPFVGIGSKVHKGDVLCIIEAMKLMNEIIAEQSGEIVDICVANGDLVEYGQTLFKIC